jgi:hypothetical protein
VQGAPGAAQRRPHRFPGPRGPTDLASDLSISQPAASSSVRLLWVLSLTWSGEPVSPSRSMASMSRTSLAGAFWYLDSPRRLLTITCSCQPGRPARAVGPRSSELVHRDHAAQDQRPRRAGSHSRLTRQGSEEISVGADLDSLVTRSTGRPTGHDKSPLQRLFG